MRLSKREPPKGIALSKVLLALAGLARAQGAYKLARFAYSKLQVWQQLLRVRMAYCRNALDRQACPCQAGAV
jgi:hypothetical protein